MNMMTDNELKINSNDLELYVRNASQVSTMLPGISNKAIGLIENQSKLKDFSSYKPTVVNSLQ